MKVRMIPPRDGAYRYARWEARFRRDAEGRLPECSSSSLDERLADPQVRARVQASFEALYQMETSVRQVLNDAGVQTILYPFYLSCARQVWKLLNRVSGDAAAQAAAQIGAKWQMRGLDPAVLARIRYEGFSIGEAG